MKTILDLLNAIPDQSVREAAIKAHNGKNYMPIDKHEKIMFLDDGPITLLACAWALTVTIDWSTDKLKDWYKEWAKLYETHYTELKKQREATKYKNH